MTTNSLLVILIVLMSAADAKPLRIHPTPDGVTCDTVREYYSHGMAWLRQQADQYGVKLSPQQMQQARACLVRNKEIAR